MPTVKTTCKVTKWEEDRTLTETPRIAPVTCEAACAEIKGTIKSWLSLVYTPDGNSIFAFTEKVEAEDFNGKKGSFITMGTGSFDGKTNYLSAEFQIVKDTGNGELEGISGKGVFSSNKDNPHNVDYEFEVNM